VNRKTRRALEQGKFKDIGKKSMPSPEKALENGAIKRIVKVTIPRIIQDNPQCSISTRDGKFVESLPINTQIVRWMRGKNEAYFELIMTSTKIISMKPVEEKEYFATPDQNGEICGPPSSLLIN